MSERQIEYIPCETCGKLIESDDICFDCHYAEKKKDSAEKSDISDKPDKFNKN